MSIHAAWLDEVHRWPRQAGKQAATDRWAAEHRAVTVHPGWAGCETPEAVVARIATPRPPVRYVDVLPPGVLHGLRLIDLAITEEIGRQLAAEALHGVSIASIEELDYR